MEAGYSSKRAEQRLAEDFDMTNYPPENWVVKSSCENDVVIIGEGMAGLAAAYALKRKGIDKIQLYDKAIAGYEGPWLSFARMPTLRSTKELVGPAQDTPGLTFRAWYTSKMGFQAWRELGKIPTTIWMDYLRWFARVLQLPIHNERTLKSIHPRRQGLALQIDQEEITTQKLVLATGRSGFGGIQIPRFADKLPSSCFKTVYEPLEFADWRGKRIALIGGGASGFDAAATALGAGVGEVEMILRRKKIPHINKGASNTYYGYVEGYYHLSDAERWAFQSEACSKGIPPPVEALRRVAGNKRFKLRLDTSIEDSSWDGEKIYLETNRGKLAYDMLLFATGFATDGLKQPELAPFIDKILLWKDRPVAQDKEGPSRFLNSPYLGAHFQFLEKEKGEAKFLKDIYCFNYAATMSHGQISGDIPGIGIGADRLARGIAVDLFTENPTPYLKRLEKYQEPEFEASDFGF